jgi:putative OmpL-like beta-barrel porin-2
VRSIVEIASLALALPLAAAEEPPKPQVELSGFVDVYYGYNDNRPSDQDNFFPGVGTTAKRDNELALNLAEIDLALPPEPVGFHFALGFGSAPDVVHAAEPSHYEHVIQASVQYQTKVGRGLLIEAGIYPSHIGFEAFQTRSNWNYTRSWLGELSPYYQTGVKLALPLSERWSTQVHLLNGWQVIEDTNRGKSLGWQLAYAAEAWSWTFNTIVGPELPDDDQDLRGLFDTVATWKPAPAWSLALSVDVARQEQPVSDDDRWYGVGLYGRFAPPDSKSALALRAGYYDDGDGAISGTPQTLREVTLTFEHRPVERLILKLEGRYDRSSAFVFAGTGVDAAGDAIRDERDQLLVLASAVVEF